MPNLKPQTKNSILKPQTTNLKQISRIKTIECLTVKKSQIGESRDFFGEWF
jgi:hypothetical protein